MFDSTRLIDSLGCCPGTVGLLVAWISTLKREKGLLRTICVMVAIVLFSMSINTRLRNR